jgi:chaperonin cofactor prefoldin
MAFVISDFQDLLALLRTHPEWRDELRPLILGEDVMRTPALIQETNEILRVVGVRLDALTLKIDALAEQQRITGERIDALTLNVDALAEQQRITGERIDALTLKVDALAEQQRITGERIDALAEQQRITGERIDALVEQQRISAERIDLLMPLLPRMDKVEIRLGHIEGDLLEANYTRHVRPSFGKWLRHANLTSAAEIEEVEAAEASGALSPQEFERLMNLDLMVVGSEKGAQPPRQMVITAEFSATISRNDVERAQLAAELLVRLGVNARPFVGGYTIAEQTKDMATERGVIVDIRRQPE